MSKRKLYPKVVNYTAKKVGDRVTIITDTGERLTAKTLQVNSHDTLYIENPDGSIYAKECTKCGKMYILNSSYHKARRDDGSERYHSHCANCRKEDIAEYTKARESKPEENTDSEELNRKIDRAIDLVICAGYGDVEFPILLIRYLKGVENIDEETIGKNATSEEFTNYMLDGLIEHLESGKRIPTFDEINGRFNIDIPDISEDSANFGESLDEDDEEDIDGESIGIALPTEIEIEELHIKSGEDSITIKGIKIKF